jgi:hypothetical protein
MQPSMWLEATILDSAALAHQSVQLISRERVQSQKFNTQRRLEIPVSSHSSLVPQLINTTSPEV